MQAFDLKLADKTFGEIQSFGVWLDKEPTRTVWFHNMLLCLINALVREYRNLVIGYKKSTPLLASACRNMLELNIYTNTHSLRARTLGTSSTIGGLTPLKYSSRSATGLGSMTQVC